MVKEVRLIVEPAVRTVASLKESKADFSDIKTDYINSFLPAATFEPGQNTLTHTKYPFRGQKGVYLWHRMY